MKELAIFNTLIISWFVLAVILFIVLFFFSAPYGRYVRNGWGLLIDNRLGWVVMESTAPVIFAVCFVLGNVTYSMTGLVFLLLWQIHYIHRSFIYPFRLHNNGKRIPFVIVFSGLFFNAVNGYLNGRWLFTLSGGYADSWLLDPRFIVGVLLFITGYVINRRADRILRSLRRPGESCYRVSNVWLYRWISCPNYLGEIIQWTGWAIATWSLAGLSFAVWTAANLIPRARAHHDWYHEQFGDYPATRKALLPGVW